MQLVPCRWQKSGWKYVEVDPSSTKYFASPNRINSVGFSPNQKPKADASMYQGEAQQFYKEDPYAQTTYGAYFKKGEKVNKPDNNLAVEKTFSAQKAEVRGDGIHWAGGLHTRQDFNKKRDPIVNWTEVLFRN